MEKIAKVQHILEKIAAPVSDQEAQMLLGAFGDDDCFGLAWTLLHLIETAPSARTADYSRNSDNMWVELLEARRRVHN